MAFCTQAFPPTFVARISKLPHTPITTAEQASTLFTLGRVVYSNQGEEYDLGIVGAEGQPPITPSRQPTGGELGVLRVPHRFYDEHFKPLSSLLALQRGGLWRTSNPQSTVPALGRGTRNQTRYQSLR